MISQSGTYIWPEYGTPTLSDIGWALSRQARFAGHTKLFYSVLSHSEVVAMLVPDELKLDALLHDSPEAVVSDTPTTWKTDFHQDMEKILLRRIYRSIGVKMPTKAQKKIIKIADQRALNAEAFVLGHPEPDYFGGNADEEAIRLTRAALNNQISVDKPQKAADRYIKLVDKAQKLKGLKIG